MWLIRNVLELAFFDIDLFITNPLKSIPKFFEYLCYTAIYLCTYSIRFYIVFFLVSFQIFLLHKKRKWIIIFNISEMRIFISRDTFNSRLPWWLEDALNKALLMYTLFLSNAYKYVSICLGDCNYTLVKRCLRRIVSKWFSY